MRASGNSCPFVRHSRVLSEMMDAGMELGMVSLMEGIMKFREEDDWYFNKLGAGLNVLEWGVKQTLMVCVWDFNGH